MRTPKEEVSQETGIHSGFPSFPLWVSALILLGLTLGMFAHILFTSKEIVVSTFGTDTSQLFAAVRHFGFSELRHGNLPLWNPHFFSGQPFFGDFQTALLYPPNYLHLLLPLAKAINLSVALHVFLTGFFMCAWCSYRGLHPLACLTSGILLMFGAPYFLHIYAGHLPDICALAWLPLLFLCIDAIVDRRSAGWCLAGIAVLSLFILAGHPQYVYFAAIACACYSGLQLIRCNERFSATMWLALMCAGAAALTSVQWLTGLAEAREAIRAQGVGYEFASSFSLPPENLITLGAPAFFGDYVHFPYWGRWLGWEMTLFIGVTGLVLACYGATRGPRSSRRFALTMTIVLTILALGAYTPLHRVLYSILPGFDKFRGASKFAGAMLPFLALLAGVGLHHLIRDRRHATLLALVVVVAAVFTAATALAIRHSAASTSSDAVWRTLARAVEDTGQSNARFQGSFVRDAGRFTSKTLLISAGTMLLLACAFGLCRKWPPFVYAVALLAVFEVIVFARSSLDVFDLARLREPEVSKLYASVPGRYRVWHVNDAQHAMLTGARDVWGPPHIPLTRYAEFVAVSQGLDPDQASYELLPMDFSPMLGMLRCRFLVVDKEVITRKVAEPLPRILLVSDYRLLKKRDDILEAVAQPDFDPHRTVILEKRPVPEPIPTESPGKAEVVQSSTDQLTIEASLATPAILVITGSYSKGWQAWALPGSAQDRYEVMPANYTLRAIPLSAGRHRLRVEYFPTAFAVGRWISGAAVVVYLLALAWYVLPRTRPTEKPSTA